MKVLLAIDGSLCSLAAVKEVATPTVAGGNRCEGIAAPLERHLSRQAKVSE